jgi:hypothetical protein
MMFVRSSLSGGRSTCYPVTGTFVNTLLSFISVQSLISLVQLLCLEEKSTSEKLDMLYRKTSYGLALNLAKTQQLDESSVADIHRQYGDHLYAKGEYDNAMQQFVQTIGHVQPSYVIRKVRKPSFLISLILNPSTLSSSMRNESITLLPTCRNYTH